MNSSMKNVGEIIVNGNGEIGAKLLEKKATVKEIPVGKDKVPIVKQLVNIICNLPLSKKDKLAVMKLVLEGVTGGQGNTSFKSEEARIAKARKTWTKSKVREEARRRLAVDEKLGSYVLKVMSSMQDTGLLHVKTFSKSISARLSVTI
jgi:hypothetical protein